ncbi:thioredoxin family protein [Bacteroidales bacterium OttesenSCG-928-C19]|nr:thioredoxin family protein [Bacteroidales bacterium OttesenSCG-928-C19]
MKKINFLTFILLLLTTLVGTSSFAQVLEPAKWTFKTKQLSNNEAELQFTVKLDDSWHIYSQHSGIMGPLPVSFEFDESADFERINGVTEPKPIVEFDEIFKDTVKHFTGTVTFKQRIKSIAKKDYTIKGFLEYQLCDDSKCIQFDKPFSFNVKGVAEEVVAQAPKDTVAATTIEAPVDTNTQEVVVENVENNTTNTPELTETEETSEDESSLWLVFFISFGMGLLALITPCVFPMIPMTISFFLKGSKDKKQGIRQGLIFGGAIIFIFAILGLLLTLLLGKDAMYIISTHPVPNVIFFVIFMFFALSFFGLFDISLPASWVNKSDQKADKGGLMGTFFIALTTVLVSFSCTGPILGAALIELTTSGAGRLVPFISMIGFAIGFALPFSLLAMFPSFLGKMKSGGWLNTVKITFGFIEIALGLKFLSMADLAAGWGILDRETYLALWIVVFTLLGFYLLGKLKFKGDEEVKQISVPRLFLSIITFSFVVYMIPGLWGAPLKALSGYVPPMTTQDFDLNRIIYENKGATATPTTASTLPMDRKYADELHLPTGFEGFFDLEEAKAYAKKVNKPIFVDFTGKTCANCREMENNVWNDPQVKSILNNEYVMVALYADANNIKLPEDEWITPADGGRTIKTLGKKNLNYQITEYSMNAQPYYVLVDANNNVLTKENKVYDKNVQNFVSFLNEGLENFKKK